MATATTNRTSLRTLLDELVAIPSRTRDIPACQQVLDYIGEHLAGLPLHRTTFQYDGHPALIFTTRPTRYPKVLLLAHADVMDAPEAMFKLAEKDGRYYGRGVFDMKGAIATYIKLLQELGPDLPDYDFGIMITADEELAGEKTAAELVRQGWRADVVINPDAVPDWQIEKAAKGYGRYRIESQGKSGHGSRPWLYRNAIKQLMEYLDELEQHYPVQEPCGDIAHAHATFSVNVIHAGTAYNQIPAKAQAEIEIRLIPGQTVAETEKRLGQVAKKHDGISITPLSVGDPTVVDPNDPYVRLFRDIVARTAGHEPEMVLSHGASDSIYFIQAGIPAIVTGPPAGGHHSDDEWLSVEGLEQFYDVIRRFIEAAAKAA